MNLDQLTEVVWQRLYPEKPRALLIGEPPKVDYNYIYVNENPYELIVLGRLSPGELLRMPTDPVCRALLEGMPVYLWPDQLHHHAGYAKLLCRELTAAEQHLKQLGVQTLGRTDRLITAEAAMKLRNIGKNPPAGSRLTPLAKDILEGKV